MLPPASSQLHHPLDEMLGSRALVRVIRLLAIHGGPLSIPDIARRTRLSLPSVRAAARRLIAQNLVTSSGGGRSIVCTLDAGHPMFTALRELYAAERRQADELLLGIRNAAAKVDPLPVGLWLYGSVSRGDDDSSSDIDIALVSLTDNVSRQADMLRESIAASATTGADRISVVGFGPNDVRRMVAARSEFWRGIERDSVVLMGDDPMTVRERFAGSGTRKK